MLRETKNVSVAVVLLLLLPLAVYISIFLSIFLSRRRRLCSTPAGMIKRGSGSTLFLYFRVSTLNRFGMYLITMVM